MEKGYSVSQLAGIIKRGKPEYQNLDDLDVLEVAFKKKPSLIRIVDTNELKRRQISKERKLTFSTLSGYDRFMSGFGRDFLGAFQAVKQIGMEGAESQQYMGYIPGTDLEGAETAKEYGQRVKDDRQPYDEAREGDFASGAGKVVGSLAATAPLPVATGARTASMVAKPILKTAIKAGAGAVTGAGYGALELTGEEESRARNALYGAMFGVGGAFTGMLLKKAGAKAVNTYREKYKDAAIQEMMDLAKKHDIPITLDMVTGKGKTTGKFLEKIPGFGTRGYMEKGVQKTQEAIKKKKSLLDESFDETIQTSLDKASQGARKQAKTNYDLVEKLSGGARTEPIHSIVEIDKVLKTFAKSRTPKQNPAIKYLEDLKESLLEKKTNFSELRATRQLLGKDATDYAMSNPTASKMLGQVRKAIDKDMDDVIEAQVKSMTKRKATQMKKLAGEPLTSPYVSREAGKVEAQQIAKGKELKKAYETARKHYAKEVVPYKQRDIINAIKSETPDELFNKYIKKGKGDKARNFYKLLDNDGKKALKDGFILNAIENATKGEGVDAFTSPAQLAGYLERMATPKNAIFKGRELKELNGFAKLMRHVERYGQINESPSNGFQLIPYVTTLLTGGAGYGLAKAPMATAAGMTAGATLTGLTSFFRTKGKGLLLASGKYEPGSVKFERAIKAVIDNLPKASSVIGTGEVE